MKSVVGQYRQHRFVMQRKKYTKRSVNEMKTGLLLQVTFFRSAREIEMSSHGIHLEMPVTDLEHPSPAAVLVEGLRMGCVPLWAFEQVRFV